MKNSKDTKRMTADERREAAQAKAQAALDRLGDGISAVWQSDAWTRWLDTMARFHDYSLNNTLLIAMQMPSATHVASYRSWQRDFSRHVRKGERGIEILVPMLVKAKADGDADDEAERDAEEPRKKLVGFKVGHVFDVSQTEGEPLPTIAERVRTPVERCEDIIEAVRSVSAYPLEFTLDLPAGTCGCFRRGDRILVRSDMPEGQTVKTCIHELAHSMLHEDPEAVPDRRMREVQAESVAYAVSAALGLDTSGYSFGYVASWAVGKTDEEMRGCMRVVRDASKGIIDALGAAMAA